MAANLESIFYVRETPWHGLGTKVMEAPASEEALKIAGLDWKVLQEPVYTMGKEQIIVVNISGRGDKDCVSIARYRGEEISE